MNWIKEEDEKPEFNTPVLAWNTCKSCRDNKQHTHNLLARSYPIHGPFIATYRPPDETLVNYRRSQGDTSWDHLLSPQWDPGKPSHWQYIKSPYEA